MRTSILTAAVLLIGAGAAVAAPHHGGKRDRGHWERGGINGYERVLIANSRSRLAALKSRAWRDGRLTFFERYQIRNAERRHNALVARLRRS
jgi:hypothetical protein